MIKNYFKMTWRTLLKNKTFSLINISGLSIGLACAMLILLYVKDEVSYDRFHHNVNNIYRIVSQSKHNGIESKFGDTGLLQGERFAKNVPGIETFVRVQSGNEDIQTGDEIHSQELLRVDPVFFSVFTFPLVSGNAETCLTEPSSIVLSEDAAMKQFGTIEVLGKTVMLKVNDQFAPFKVTAIAKRCPQNSSLKFDVILPLKISMADAQNYNNWDSYFLNTFVVLNSNANLQTVESQMQVFYMQDAVETYKESIKKYGDDGGSSMGTYFLQSFTDMHMNTELPAQNGLVNSSNPMYSYLLSGIALFVLLIACINFINLTIARSIKRAKEIGIRKVIGSGRKQLIIQFLGESCLLCFIAFTLALLIVQLVLPVFNNLANKALSFTYLLDVKLIAGYLVLFLITGLLAGFYPALVLSGYKPVETLYSRFNLSSKNYLQKSLVIVQFSLASFLIIATLTIYKQFNYLTKTDLGYDDSNIVQVKKPQIKHSEAALFKAELLKNSNIVDVAPKNGGQWWTVVKLFNDSTINFHYETVDESYLPALKIPLLQGRNFSASFPSDSANAVLVNEAFVKKAGWKTPIGETVNFIFNNNEIYKVVGVVKDYHYQALNQKIGPQLFTMRNSNPYGMFNIKIRPGTETECLKFIQKTFKQYFPLSPYSYQFKNDQRIKDYEAEAKWKLIILFGAILTIFISCIGLFGLSVLSAEKRTKEIGIRKVLGASVNSVVTTLSRDFLKFVLIALVIAIPVAWMASNKWLQNYPYRTTLDWWLFAIASVLVISVALVTVIFQAVKAAIANPVKSLRTE